MILVMIQVLWCNKLEWKNINHNKLLINVHFNQIYFSNKKNSKKKSKNQNKLKRMNYN